MDQTQFDVVFQFITEIYPSHMAASKFQRDMSSTAVQQGQFNSRHKDTALYYETADNVFIFFSDSVVCPTMKLHQNILMVYIP